MVLWYHARVTASGWADLRGALTAKVGLSDLRRGRSCRGLHGMAEALARHVRLRACGFRKFWHHISGNSGTRGVVGVGG